MTTANIFTFSHNDIEETAKETKLRTEKAEPMCEEEFIKLIGNFAYKSFVKAFDAFGKTYKSGSVIFVSIQNIDYIFSK